MSESIEIQYFDWLRAKVLPMNTQNYYELMRILYCTEFVWFVPGDRNRKDDGLELREYFLNESGLDNDPIWFNEPCSLLEFFIALAYRASFQTDISVRDWFWTFMANLNLDQYRQISESDTLVIEDILDTFVWRKYDSNGYGGIFPLYNSDKDQREIEYWYQFSDYVTEQELI